MRRFVRLGRPSEATLDRLLARSAGAELTYDHVGSTITDDPWPGRTRHHEELVLGRGDACFRAATAGLRAWACHRGIRARIHPGEAPLEVGTDLLVVLPAGPFTIVVPDRVVAVVDTPDRFGFAYGTLPGHQERGEEAFLVERSGDGVVRATINVDATTATTAARLLSPGVTWFQHLAVRRYLGALRDDVRSRLAAGAP